MTSTDHPGRDAVTLVALSLTFGLVPLDATIVNVALTTVHRDLGGGLGLTQWLVDGYAVPFSAFLLAAGAIGDRGGHRRTCVAGFALFALASVPAALATTWGVLLAARAVQGVGAALMLPASLALVGELYPEPRARSRALGVWGGVATAGFAAGPVVGGLLISVWGWPAIFWLNLPVGAVLAAVIGRLAPPDVRRERGLDPLGTLLGVLALGTLVAGVIEAGQRHLLLAGALLGASVLLGVLFVRTERRAAAPLVPLDLASTPAFRAVLVTGFCFNLAMYGLLLCASLVLQSLFGLSPLGAGLAVLPMALVVSIGATTSGFLAAATGPRRPMVIGFAAGIAGAVLVSVAGARSEVALVVGLGILGLVSIAMPAMTSVALAVAPSGHAGLAGGALNTARQVGGAVGVALLGAVLNAGGDDAGLRVAGVLAALGLAGGVVASLASTRYRADHTDEVVAA